jgi:MYXO-CTERM domain-containing protein
VCPVDDLHQGIEANPPADGLPGYALELAPGGEVFLAGTSNSPMFLGTPNLALDNAFIVRLAVDSTPPAIGDVTASFVRHATESGSYEVTAEWSGFSDPQSADLHYAWALGTSAGAEDVLPFKSVREATSDTRIVALQTGRTYHVTVRATNCASATTVALGTMQVSGASSPLGWPIGCGCSTPPTAIAPSVAALLLVAGFAVRPRRRRID